MERPVPRLTGDLSLYQPLINKMMAKEKEKRISSAPQFAQVLNNIKKNI
jgi:hypothetical protein